jgi:hypothetical protein
MSALQARHEGPGFKASKIRTKGSFLCGEIGDLLGFPNSVSNVIDAGVSALGSPG